MSRRSGAHMTVNSMLARVPTRFMTRLTTAIPTGFPEGRLPSGSSLYDPYAKQAKYLDRKDQLTFDRLLLAHTGNDDGRPRRPVAGVHLPRPRHGATGMPVPPSSPPTLQLQG
jgi:hypothetical protein